LPKKPKLVVALLTEDQEFQRLQADDARVSSVHAGFDVEIVYADNSAILQIQQLYKFVHASEDLRPTAIIVETVVAEGLERVARAAARAGIGWELLNCRVSYLDSLRAEFPALPIAAVSTDQREIGAIQARQFQALIPTGRGVVLYVQGPPDSSAAIERLFGAQEALASTGIALKVVNGAWTEASGEQAVSRWLRLKSSEEIRPDVLGCQNDAMAVGARRVIEAQGSRADLGRVPLTGCDGLPDGGQRLVNMGQLAATVVSPSNTGPAIDLVARALRAGRIEQAELLLKPSSYPPEGEIARRFAARRQA
jgi:ABC-type sugar transport system substrate-binding protein